MPRVAGQIDRVKNEAILDAASHILCERGFGASLDQISRRAGVSKQTIYNHYGSKEELMRALIARRGDLLAAPFDLPDAEARPETALAAYARTVLEALTCGQTVAVLRLIVGRAASAPAPEEAKQVLRVMAEASRDGLAEFLARETQNGILAIEDPSEAAGFFVGMVIGDYRLLVLIGLPLDLDAARIERRATEAARRFVRAYAP